MIATFATSTTTTTTYYQSLLLLYTILIIFTDVTVGKKLWAICTSLSPPPPFGQGLNQLLIEETIQTFGHAKGAVRQLAAGDDGWPLNASHF